MTAFTFHPSSASLQGGYRSLTVSADQFFYWFMLFLRGDSDGKGLLDCAG